MYDDDDILYITLVWWSLNFQAGLHLCAQSIRVYHHLCICWDHAALCASTHRVTLHFTLGNPFNSSCGFLRSHQRTSQLMSWGSVVKTSGGSSSAHFLLNLMAASFILPAVSERIVHSGSAAACYFSNCPHSIMFWLLFGYATSQKPPRFNSAK